MIDTSFSIENSLNAFINRFHYTELVRGLVKFFILLVISYGLLWVTDSIFFYTMYQRLVAVILFSVIGFFFGFFWIIKPLLARFTNLGRLSFYKAIDLISQGNSALEDRLINWYNLRYSQSNWESDLLVAAVKQQAVTVERYDLVFWLKFWPSKALLISLLAVFVIQLLPIIFYTDQFFAATNRLMHPSTDFKEVAPFSFVLINKNLTVYKYESLSIDLKVNGKVVPDEVYLNADSSRYLMVALGNGQFRFTFPQVNKDFDFHFQGGGFDSEIFNVRVIEKPIIEAVKMSVTYPGYLQMVPKDFEGASDLEVPEGSKVRWTIRAGLASEVQMNFQSLGDIVLNDARPIFTFDHQVMMNDDISIKVLNDKSLCTDSLSMIVKVIRDEAPSISASIVENDVVSGQFSFEGVISDDHGLSGLKFVILRGEESVSEQNIVIQPGAISQHFFYNISVGSLPSVQGVDLIGQFIVTDNNFVTGPGKGYSPTFILKKLNEDEVDKFADSLGNGVRGKLSKLLDDNKAEQDRLKQLKKDFRGDGKFDWKEKKELQSLLESKKEEINSIEELRKRLLKENEIRQSSKEPISEILRDKQEKIQELMKEVFDKDLLQKIEQIQKALDSLSVDKIGSKLEELESLMKKTEQSLDRNLNLLEQLKRDMEIEKLASKIDKLKEAQSDLNKKREENSKADMSGLQDSLVNKLEKDILDDIKSIDSLSNRIEASEISKNVKAHLDEARKQMKESSSSDKKGSNKKAGEAGKKAEEELEKASEEINQMMSEEEASSAEEDFEDIRQLIENSLELSFRQENLIKEINGISLSSPSYVDIGRKQRWIKDDVLGIKDSLVALSRKSVNIPEFIFDKLDNINGRLASVLANHQDRKVSDVMSGQQFVMSEMNNLILVLSEVENQMKRQSQSMNSSGQCKSNKPSKGGKGKASLKKIKEMQNQLGEELSKMREGMKNKQKGKNGEGDQGQDDQFGKMAMEQMMIRRQLDELRESMKQETGQASGDLDRIGDDMEKLEQDLLFKRLNDQTLKRQEQIETRLLKSEKALEEREMDNKRESKSGNLDQIGNPLENMQYKGNKRNAENILIRENIRLAPYYRSKSNEYLNHNLQYGKD